MSKKLKQIKSKQVFLWEDSWLEIETALATADLKKFRSQENSVIARRITEPRSSRKEWQRACEELPTATYVDSRIGSPKTFEYNNVQVTSNSLRHAFLIARIREKFPPEAPIKVLEVGAGYGGFAEQLARQYEIEKFYLLDGKPMIQLQKYYLTKAGYGDRLCFEAPTEKVDLIVSTNSLAEMSLETVTQYIQLFEQVLKPKAGLMYLKQREKATSPHLYTSWKDYPFDEKWTLEITNSKRSGREFIECFGRR